MPTPAGSEPLRTSFVPRVGSPPTPAAPAAAVSVPASGTTLAPDGMVRNTVVRPTSLSRADVVAAAKTAGVPQRVQIGPTCGLYALGMVMDRWNEADAKNPTALVQDLDLRGAGKQYTRAPTTEERILDRARAEGFTTKGEMYVASQLAALARGFGYDAVTHHGGDVAKLYEIVARGHPAIIAYDVDYNGDPVMLHGARAHYAVIEGKLEERGQTYLIARHGWGAQTDHVWDEPSFLASWRGLARTDCYTNDKDPWVRPARHVLPSLPGGYESIRETLAAKIVEVVPVGVQVTPGGSRA